MSTLTPSFHNGFSGAESVLPNCATPHQCFEVPLIFSTNQTEFLNQMADSMSYLRSCVETSFQAVRSRIDREKSRLEEIQARASVAEIKIKAISQTKNAVVVHSSAKYSAPTTATNKHNPIVCDTKQMKVERVAYKYPVGYQGTSTTTAVNADSANDSSKFDLPFEGRYLPKVPTSNEGLGRLPVVLKSVCNLHLFGTTENPYKKFVSVDTLGTEMEEKMEKKKTDTQKLPRAPMTVENGEGLDIFSGYQCEFKPAAPNMPFNNMSLVLPLPNVASDVFLQHTNVLPIAPTAQSGNISIRTVEQTFGRCTAEHGNINLPLPPLTRESSFAPPAAQIPPPLPPLPVICTPPTTKNSELPLPAGTVPSTLPVVSNNDKKENDVSAPSSVTAKNNGNNNTVMTNSGNNKPQKPIAPEKENIPSLPVVADGGRANLMNDLVTDDPIGDMRRRRAEKEKEKSKLPPKSADGGKGKGAKPAPPMSLMDALKREFEKRRPQIAGTTDGVLEEDVDAESNKMPPTKPDFFFKPNKTTEKNKEKEKEKEKENEKEKEKESGDGSSSSSSSSSSGKNSNRVVENKTVARPQGASSKLAKDLHDIVTQMGKKIPKDTDGDSADEKDEWD